MIILSCCVLVTVRVVRTFTPKTSANAYYVYSFYLQVNSELIESGQELLIPGEGVQAFLIETRAPFIYCSGDLNGRIQILEVAKKTLRARLDVSGTIHGARWEYRGEVKFKFSIRPHSLP